MRVLTWNMGMLKHPWPRPGLQDQAWHFLLGLAPDIAFVQETFPPAWVRGEGTLIHEPITKAGSVLFSPRYPIERVRPPQGSNLRSLGAYLAFGRMTIPDGSELLIVSVHARHGNASAGHLTGLGGLARAEVKRASLRKPHVNDAVFMGLRSMVPNRFLVAGDWNTAREQSDPDAGVQFFKRIEEAEWYDCSWEANDHQEIPTRFKEDSSIQDDHAFCDPTLGASLRSVVVTTDAVAHWHLSDHAPLVLDFDVEPISQSNL